MKVECLWPNIWTSKGRMICGETMDLPKDEAVSLGDAVKIIDAPKAEKAK